MSPNHSHTDSISHASRAARIVEIVERLEANEPVDLESYCNDCPELRDELEELLPVMMAVVEMKPTASKEAHAHDIDPMFKTLGDFRLIREIGRGGMGIVYEAEERMLGRQVALKVLPLAATLSPQQLQRFRNEARTAATLRHPHIVGVYSVGVERGIHYYAMELVEGCSLAQMIAELACRDSGSRRGSGSASSDTTPVAALSTLLTQDPQEYYRQVARRMADVADALDYAHSQGVVHRDIKPANLLLDRQSRIWITDFGLARLESDTGITLTGDVLGTLRYMSPEQAAGKSGMVDYRTDLHALGATLYELIALRPAFDSPDRGELVRSITADPPPPLRHLVPHVPRDLETIVLKVLEKEPSDRYESAAQLAADLRAFAEHRVISARPPSISARLQKWARRHTALVAVALGVVTLGMIGLTVGLLMLRASNARVIVERNEARGNLQLAAEAVDRLLGEMGSVAESHGELIQAERFLGEADQFYQRMIRKSTDPEVVRRAANGFNRIGSLHSKLGHQESAIKKHQAALELLGRLSDLNWEREDVSCTRAESHQGTAHAYKQLLDAYQVEMHANLAREIWLQLLERDPENVAYIDGLMNTLNSLAAACMDSDRPQEAEQVFTEILDLHQRLPEATRQSAGQRNSLAGTRCNLGTLLVELGRLDEAEPHLQAAVPIQASLVVQFPELVRYREDLNLFRWNLIDLHVRQRLYDQAAMESEELAGTNTGQLRAQYEAADLLLRCVAGVREAKMAHLEDAARQWQERARQLVADARVTPQTSVDTIGYFAWFLTMCRDETLRAPSRALDLAEQALSQAPERRFIQRARGIALYRLGQYEASAAAFRQMIETGGIEGTDALFLAMSQFQLGDREAAELWYQKASRWQRVQPATSVYDFLAEARTQVFAEADRLLQSTIAGEKPADVVLTGGDEQ